MQLLAPQQKPFPGAGCAITVIGDFEGQLVHWTVASHDPLGVSPDGPAKGFLKWTSTFIGSDLRSVNFYYSPDIGVGRIKYGSGRQYTDGYVYGHELTVSVGDCERVTVRSGSA